MDCTPPQSTDPELLVYELDFNKPVVEQALAITADYVAKHRLILTGGTAIDMALRSKGQSIYDDNALPDYDIMSSDNLKHAAALAEILCNQGFKDISVITAIHIVTVRVRYKRTVLLDATYVPEILIEQIPYIDVGKFRLVHPDYQKIDQCQSLSMLMNDTGLSLNIFNRMVKDIKRNKILREVFPMGDLSLQKIPMQRIVIPLKALAAQPEHLNEINKDCFVYTGDVCCTGYIVYALLYHEFTKNNKPLDGTIDPAVVVTKTTLEFDIPTGMAIAVLNCADNIESALEAFSKQIEPKKRVPTKKFNALLGIKPITLSKKYKNYAIEASDTYGVRISANCIELNGHKIVFANTYYICADFLRDKVYGDSESRKNLNALCYRSLLSMMLRMQEADGPKIWFPSINCYGYDNLAEYKAFALEKILDPEGSKDFKPKHSYLRVPKCMAKSKFDPSVSHYFAIDGLENDNIIHTNLKWVKNAIQLKAIVE